MRQRQPRRSSKTGICTYCGEVGEVTKDHIPPKNLFPLPRPGNMRTVPACLSCNAGFQADDDYLRIALTVPGKAKGHSDREAVLPTVLRGLGRPQAAGLANSLEEQVFFRELITPSGIYLGRTRAIKLDGHRLERTAARIIKGLCFHELGYRLTERHKIHAVNIERMDEARAWDPKLAQALCEVIAHTAEKKRHMVGTTFAYQFAAWPTGSQSVAWLLYFYGRLEFVCTSFLRNSDDRWLDEDTARIMGMPGPGA